jgi:hypothetical protein
VGKDAATLGAFFDEIGPEEAAGIEAVSAADLAIGSRKPGVPGVMLLRDGIVTKLEAAGKKRLPCSISLTVWRARVRGQEGRS